MRSYLIVIYTFWFSIAHAGAHAYLKHQKLAGGDIIGNGGGIAESNFIHAYTKLYKFIDSCIESRFCVQNEKQRSDLIKIRNLSSRNYKNVSKIKFASSQVYPQLFETDDSHTNRLAVTGLNENDPIYVNLDLLYTENDKGISYPALNFNEIVAILVHELGHNIGETDHNYLDFLGSIVSFHMKESLKHFTYNVSGEIFEVNFVNYDQEYRLSDFWVTWSDHSFKLTERLYIEKSCSNAERPSSISFVNYHREKLKQKGSVSYLPLNVWAKYTCAKGSVSFVEYIDVMIHLKTNKVTGETEVQYKFKYL